MTMFIILAVALVGFCLWALVRPFLANSETRSAREHPKLLALQRAHRDGVISDDELADKRARLLAELNDTASTGDADANAATDPTRHSNPTPNLKMAIGIAAFLVFSTVFVYAIRGEPRALNEANLVTGQSPENSMQGNAQSPMGNGEMPPDLEQATQQLEAKLAADPSNLDGWLLLARSHKAMQKFLPAAQALRKAHELAPDNDDVATELAEQLALSSESRRIEGEALDLIDAVLERNPRHERALWLRGIRDAQNGEASSAIARWTTLLSVLPPESEVRNSIIEQIKNLAQEAGLPTPDLPAANAMAANAENAGAPVNGTTAMPSDSATTQKQITVSITISDALQAKRKPGDVLYVFARLPDGPKMPLAIQRIADAKFPLQITLDESMGMMPQMSLATAEQVVVGARISQSGIANAQSGDFESSLQTIQFTKPDQAATLTIDAIRP